MQGLHSFCWNFYVKILGFYIFLLVYFAQCCLTAVIESHQSGRSLERPICHSWITMHHHWQRDLEACSRCPLCCLWCQPSSFHQRWGAADLPWGHATLSATVKVAVTSIMKLETIKRNDFLYTSLWKPKWQISRADTDILKIIFIFDKWKLGS